ncbi:MAG: DUF1700 domain-containing protein [Spirochaetes bacterium]|nr:DUF1700 domain-containing protein [Spirochaetota bacterium]
MNRMEFIRSLEKSLSKLPPTEVEDIVRDYEEHFDAGMQKGKTEEEIAQALGNPRMIGKVYRMDSLLQEEKKHTFQSTTRAVFASLGLGLFNVIFVLGPYAGLLGVLAGLWAASAALAACGFAVTISVPFGLLLPSIVRLSGISPVFLLFTGIGVCATGILAVIGMMKLSALFFEMTVRYLRFNLRVIKKEA